MGKCEAVYKEVRFLIDTELLEVYVAIDAIGDCPLNLQGWHHKTFPKSVSAIDVLEKIKHGEEEPMMWGRSAPK